MFGTVPASPDSRLPAPSAATAPCTARKSTARGLRQAICWIAMESPIVSVAPIRVTKTKAGRSPQNAGPNPRSKPGQPPDGMPTQEAASTLSMS